MAGSAFHAPLIAATPGLRLSAVVTANAERAGQVRTRYPGVPIFDHADAIWQRAETFDLVVVATPNRSHAALASSALQAGLPVVIDKPMASSSVEARDLFALARDRKLLLSVFQNRRWDSDFLTLQALLADGRLGPVRRFESRFERWRPTVKPGWRQSAAPEDAGGVLFDLGSHLIDQALTLFGDVTQVYAELDARYPETAADADSFVALTHAGGVRSHLWMSSVAPQLGPRLRVLGARAAYLKHGLDPQEAALREGRRPGADDWGTEPAAAWGWLEVDGRRETIPSRNGDYPAFYRGIVAALRQGDAPPVAAEDALRVLELIEAARTSAHQRQVVTPRGR